MPKRAYKKLHGGRTFKLNTETGITVSILRDGYVSIGGMCSVSMEDFFAIGKVAARVARDQPTNPEA